MLLQNGGNVAGLRGPEKLESATSDHRLDFVARRPWSNEQELLDAFLHGVLDGAEGFVNGATHGLLQVGHGAESESAAAIVVSRDDVHGNVPRGRIVLKSIEHGPTNHVRQSYIEGHGARLEFLGERK